MNTTVDTELIQSLPGSHFAETACSADSVTLYQISDCYWAGSSPFANIVIARSPTYGKVLFLDKELQSAESDEAIYHEHLVHPVMNATAHIRNKNVLVVGGGEGATVREVLKYDANSVANVYWIDIDEGLVELCRRHLGWASDDIYNNQRVHFCAADIRSWLQNRDMTFDVIILDLPDPDVDALIGRRARGGAGINQQNALYSLEFFEMLRYHMGPQSALVTHAGPIAPGRDTHSRSAGLQYIIDVAAPILNQYGSHGTPYHVNIPSFQSEWGFWMSVQPAQGRIWPQGLRVMDDQTQALAMTWPNYWRSI